jgi:hypothetical protein
MEPEGSLPHSQVPATCTYPKPTRSSPYPHIAIPEDPFSCTETNVLLLYREIKAVYSDIRKIRMVCGQNVVPLPISSTILSDNEGKSCSKWRAEINLTLRLEEDHADSIRQTDFAVSPDMIVTTNSLSTQSTSHHHIPPMTSHLTCSIGPYWNTEMCDWTVDRYSETKTPSSWATGGCRSIFPQLSVLEDLLRPSYLSLQITECHTYPAPFYTTAPLPYAPTIAWQMEDVSTMELRHAHKNARQRMLYSDYAAWDRSCGLWAVNCHS